MTWREQLRPASFRGVPFFVDGHEADLGRRVQVHEYPLRDKPYGEDLGRKVRGLSVDAYVIGAEYMAARDRLIAAVEQAGPGKLVHPYLGELNVTVTGCKLRESTAEGGMARFGLTLVEAGEATFPATLPDTRAVVRTAAELALDAAVADFLGHHAVAKKPEFVSASAASTLTKALDAVKGAVATVRSVAAKVSALAQRITQIKQDIISVVFEPARAAQELVAAVKQAVREVAYGPREAFDLARTLFRFGSDLPNVPTHTPSRRQQAANQAAMVKLVRVAAVAEGAAASSELEFESYQDALSVRASITDAADELMEADDTGDALYDALRALRAATVRDITARAPDLARVVAYTPATTLPALVIAHELYADATRSDEIVARNRIAHPSFVRGQRALEVLADA
jgi:prophage DNA circulation protein